MSSTNKKVQKYAKEEARLLEDVRHGIAVGTNTFVDSIRKKVYRMHRKRIYLRKGVLRKV